jgi:hypothetical protein
MRKIAVLGCALVLVAAVPAPAAAWGFAAHRYIMGRAIDLLPPEMKPFFDHFRAELVVRVVDPDVWRSVGWEDDPNHFVDFGDPLIGPFPFAGLPRDYDAALGKFGMTTLKRLGMLPWREAEEFGNLRRAYEGFTKNSAYASTDVVLFAAVAAHYIQDAHQPLHATNNYNGQLTGNDGIHARFERDLFERFESRLVVRPAAPAAVTSPRDAAFDMLLASHQLVDALLTADKEAAAGKTFYDDDYFEKFFTAARPMLEQQLAASITATAGVLIGAWEQAGRPALKTVDARPPQRVRSSRTSN